MVERAAFLPAVREEERDVAKQLKLFAMLLILRVKTVTRRRVGSLWRKHACNNLFEALFQPINTFRLQHLCVGVTV